MFGLFADVMLIVTICAELGICTMLIVCKLQKKYSFISQTEVYAGPATFKNVVEKVLWTTTSNSVVIFHKSVSSNLFLIKV